MSELLSVEDLTISFPHRGGRVAVVRGVGFEIGAGELVGLVGESGSGKSMTALALLGLLPPSARIDSGSVRLAGRELVGLPESELQRVRGDRVAMIFQEPMTALNPVLTVGYQIVEAIRAHRRLSRAEATERARHLLELVAIPRPQERLDDYPHQLSGGQRQRAMIAMALAADPALLIADEPTTALDVTIQAQILELLEELQQRLGLAVLLITHDLGVVAEVCHRALVMYAGRIVEEAPVEALFARPEHPYTRGLLSAQPRLEKVGEGGELPTIPGQIPDPVELPTGCAFHPRCPEVMPHCSLEEPPLYQLGGGRRSACYLHDPSHGARHAAG